MTSAVLFVIVFSVISIQDFLERKVYVVVLIFPFIIGVLAEYLGEGYFPERSFFLINLLTNFLIGSILVLSLMIYVKLIKGKNSIIEFFGLGDIILVFSLTAVFPYHTYLKVLIAGCCFGMGHALLKGKLKSNYNEFKIPLASWFSISSIVFLFLK